MDWLLYSTAGVLVAGTLEFGALWSWLGSMPLPYKEMVVPLSGSRITGGLGLICATFVICVFGPALATLHVEARGMAKRECNPPVTEKEVSDWLAEEGLRVADRSPALRVAAASSPALAGLLSGILG